MEGAEADCMRASCTGPTAARRSSGVRAEAGSTGSVAVVLPPPGSQVSVYPNMGL